MNYKNGKDVLPLNILELLQEYIQGEAIYIPKKENKRAAWGTLNGTRRNIAERNEEIYNGYRNGCSMENLMESYCLSDESIRKILLKEKQKQAVKKIGA